MGKGADTTRWVGFTSEEKRGQAQIEAKTIIERLDPEHIDSWPGLIEILEDALETAKRNAELIQI